MIAGAATAAGALVAAYPLLMRSRCLTWGATPDEARQRLPGDELLPGAQMITTRAIGIDAPAEAVWPWLIQMGSGRAGAYSYDWIENLFGLDMHSASVILPQFQDLKLGDELPMGRGRPAMRVVRLDPGHVFALQVAGGNWVWIFALLPLDGGTRLLSRNRISLPSASAPARAAWSLLMEPGSLIMERKMLLGIKERAERLARDRAELNWPRPAS
ncbi:MAG: hypothetical protein ACR2FU_12270 [Streptosporangiaceae bacterium]